jgi:hypothetical protein
MELINDVFLGGMWIASYRYLTLEREGAEKKTNNDNKRTIVGISPR